MSTAMDLLMKSIRQAFREIIPILTLSITSIGGQFPGQEPYTRGRGFFHGIKRESFTGEYVST